MLKFSKLVISGSTLDSLRSDCVHSGCPWTPQRCCMKEPFYPCCLSTQQCPQSEHGISMMIDSLDLADLWKQLSNCRSTGHPWRCSSVYDWGHLQSLSSEELAIKCSWPTTQATKLEKLHPWLYMSTKCPQTHIRTALPQSSFKPTKNERLGT